MLGWNKALWLAFPRAMTIFNQSECFISPWHSYNTHKCVCDIGSSVTRLGDFVQVFKAFGNN